MTGKNKRVQRVTDWEHARYSIVPPRAAADERLKLAHFRVMTYLGRVNTQQGWCEFSQKAAANALPLGRQAINSAVSDLVEWGYVERMGQKLTKSALCQYRLMVDEPDDGDVSPTDDTPPKGRVAHGRHTCPSEATHVSPAEDTNIDHRSERSERDARGHRLPEDWKLPDDWREWAKKYAPSRALYISSEAESFRDYWCDKPGRDALKLNWRGTWQRWWRRACERSETSGIAKRFAASSTSAGRTIRDTSETFEQLKARTGWSSAR